MRREARPSLSLNIKRHSAMKQLTAPQFSRPMPTIKATDAPNGKKDDIEDRHTDSIHKVEQKFEDSSENDVSKCEDSHRSIL